MFKGLGNLANLMKQAQEMQGRMNEVKERLANVRVEASSGGGMVTVTATGQQKIVSCRIEPKLLESGDQEMLEDLIVAATNQAIEKSKDRAAEEMAAAAESLNIPGLDQMMGKFMGGDLQG